jgi:Flp pilus assembly protein TadG
MAAAVHTERTGGAPRGTEPSSAKIVMPESLGTRLRRRLRDQRGQSLMEAALVAPLLLMVTFAIIDFGLLFYVYLALESGVSQAARYGITGNALEGMSRQDSIKSMIRRATPTLTIPDDSIQFSHLAGGAWVAGTGGPGDIEKLTITYTHNVLVLRPFFTDGQIQLRVESSMKNEDRFE